MASGRQRDQLLDEPGKKRVGQLSQGELFSSLKTERTTRRVYRTRDEARADIFDYINRFYHPRIRHPKLGCLSPMQFEARAMLA